MEGIEFVDNNKNFVLWHDRDLKLNGLKWLKNQLENLTK